MWCFKGPNCPSSLGTPSGKRGMRVSAQGQSCLNQHSSLLLEMSGLCPAEPHARLICSSQDSHVSPSSSSWLHSSCCFSLSCLSDPEAPEGQSQSRYHIKLKLTANFIKSYAVHIFTVTFPQIISYSITMNIFKKILKVNKLHSS